MININKSSLLPSIDSFQYNIPLTSTPKRSNKTHCSRPLSSTLSIANRSYKKMDLSISAITFIKKSSIHKKKRHHQRRTYYIHSSTIIKRIELKDLLYTIPGMKQQESKQRYYTENEMKIYVV